MCIRDSAHTPPDESQKEGRVERIPPISQGHNFNTVNMIEAIIKLQDAHMEFVKAFAKQKSTRDGSMSSFNLKLDLINQTARVQM